MTLSASKERREIEALIDTTALDTRIADKVEELQALQKRQGSTKPACMSACTTSTGISSICSCLSMPTPTTTVTTTSVTSTTKVATTVAAQVNANAFKIDNGCGLYAVPWGNPSSPRELTYSFVLNYNTPGDAFTLSPSCIFTHVGQGKQLYADTVNGSGRVVTFKGTPSSDYTAMTCLLGATRSNGAYKFNCFDLIGTAPSRYWFNNMERGNFWDVSVSFGVIPLERHLRRETETRRSSVA